VRIAPALAPPKQLGKYEVGAKIGGGGMATVYVGRATREDGTEERVALKVIRDELAHDEQFKSMFIDEAKILAQLSHPNVIHTLEYGVTGAHRFIAMELLSGRTYSDVWDLLAMKGEKMPPWLAAWLCARIADGLHSAHELVDDVGQPLGVIHRDVNPSNIFLTHGGDVKLIDFGLAKARVRLSKSEDGIVKGKIPYLAPEQAHGRPIDRRIDVYALGATLWESSTMKRLFKRDTDVDTLRAIREAKVPDVRTMVEGFPPDLWYIIEKSLRIDRDARYETADEFRKELDDFVGARAPQMKDELASLLTRLFPGQEERQATWERAAASVRMPVHTMPPPAPVPVASTSMLEPDSASDRDSDAGPAPSKPPESATVKVGTAAGAAAKAKASTETDAKAKPVAEPRAEAPAPTPTPTATPTPSPAKTKPKGKTKAKAKGKSKGKAKSKAKSRASHAPPARESERPRSVPAAPRSRRAAETHVENTDRFAAARDPAAPKRMWISLLIVAAVLLALALAVAAR
jgi:serine/threonine-protein kinase